MTRFVILARSSGTAKEKDERAKIILQVDGDGRCQIYMLSEKSKEKCKLIINSRS